MDIKKQLKNLFGSIPKNTGDMLEKKVEEDKILQFMCGKKVKDSYEYIVSYYYRICEKNYFIIFGLIDWNISSIVDKITGEDVYITTEMDRKHFGKRLENYLNEWISLFSE